MDCNNPELYRGGLAVGDAEEISERRMEILSRYADGEAPGVAGGELEEHLSKCTGCSAMLSQFRIVNRLGQDRGRKVVVCPSALDLESYEFAREEIDPVLRAHLSRHLQSCELCGDEIAWLRKHQGKIPRQARLRMILAAAAAILLMVLSFFGARSYLRVQEPDDLAALVSVPALDPSSLASLPEISDPEDRSRYEGAVSLLLASRVREATATLVALSRREPAQPRVLLLLGSCYAREGRWAECYETTTRARICPPLSLERCWYLANLCLKVHDRARAEIELEHVLSLNPDHREARLLKRKLAPL